MTEDRHTPVPAAFPWPRARTQAAQTRGTGRMSEGKGRQHRLEKEQGLRCPSHKGRQGMPGHSLQPPAYLCLLVLPARHRMSSVTRAGAEAVLCPQRGITAWSCAVPTSPPSAWALEPRRPECSRRARLELTQCRNVTAESPTCRRCCWGLARLCSCQLAGGNAEGDIHTHTSSAEGVEQGNKIKK